MPNIKCGGQKEIDLLAIDAANPKEINRYHIESGVSISGSYSLLTNSPFSIDDLKVRVKQAGQRRTLGYFIEHKFNNKHVLDKLKEYGFKRGNYTKVIVTWGVKDDVPKAAKRVKIEIWVFKQILKEIAELSIKDKTYFMDDTMRTLQLMAMTKK